MSERAQALEAAWERIDGREQRLLAGTRELASLWHNADNWTWHTWDEHGVGGENGVDRDEATAKREVIAALQRQGWMPASLSPVEPTPEPPRSLLHYFAGGPDGASLKPVPGASWEMIARLAYARDYLAIHPEWPRQPSVEPAPPTPAPCVWRDITKERPPHGVNVDVWARGRRIADAYYVVNEGEEPFWCDDEGYNVRDVTHWMPLPAPPQITR